MPIGMGQPLNALMGLFGGDNNKRNHLSRLNIDEEATFQKDYQAIAKMLDLSPDPDDPLHFYDYRAAWKAGQLRPDTAGHFSSQFKLAGHPRKYVHPDGRGSATPKPGFIDTTTGKMVNGHE